MRKGHAKEFLGAILVSSAFAIAISPAIFAAEITYTPKPKVDVDFELIPSVAINIVGGDLIIPHLVPGHAENSNEITIQVATNNLTGYTLKATVGDTEVANPTRSLIHSDTTVASRTDAPEFTMLAPDSVQSTAEFTATTNSNKWGFSIDSGATYSGLNLYNDGETPEIDLYSTSTVGMGQTPFLIGANADASMSAGIYGNKINFYAVTNFVPEPEGSLSTIDTMQEMTPEICAASSIGESSQLVDIREDADGNTRSYWVTKLADNNCWMTQNLDLDIVAGNIYTPDDTDIPEDWEPELDTYTDYTWNWSYTTPESFDPGDLYWDGTEDYDWSSTIDDLTESGDEHYHIGNYYNWTAALAMNDSSDYYEFGQNVDQSICPAGWTLPKGGVTEDWSALASNNQFGPLFSNYLTDGNWSDTYWEGATISPIYSDPLYFVLGGYWGGGSIGVASSGYYWSSTVNDDSYAFDFYFDVDGDVYPDNGNDRGDGFSVRCVAR